MKIIFLGLPILQSLKILLITLFIIRCSNQGNSQLNNSNTNSDTALFHKPSNFNSKLSTDSIYTSKIYSQAIADYIQLVEKEYKLKYDTLYFGKHVYNQTDDFPNIVLPQCIESTQIRLITPEQGEKNKNDRKSSCYINLIGTVNEEVAEFIFINFSNDFAHQYDCFINYKNDTLTKEYKLNNFRFENFRYNLK